MMSKPDHFRKVCLDTCTSCFYQQWDMFAKGFQHWCDYHEFYIEDVTESVCNDFVREEE